MKKMLSPKKPFLWLMITAIVAATVLGVLFVPRKAEVSAALDECVVSTLRMVHKSSHTEGKYPAVVYTPLAVKEKGDTVTVYGVMMYREYTCTTADQLETWGEGHDPFAITATKNADGTYTATDCWWPENGADYIPSIRKQFPSYCQRKAVTYRKFYTDQRERCGAQALQNITDAEKYVVLESESENMRLAYCEATATSYINFSGGYATDGSYAVTQSTATFTFGNRKLVFAIEDEALVFDLEASEEVPAIWQSAGDTEYLQDGVRFVADDGDDIPAIKLETAPIGPTVTVTSSNWVEEETLREMFGQYVPSTYFESVDPKYLPVRPIENRGQLERFIEAFADEFTDMDLERFAAYDEAFFKDNIVLITYYKDGMDSCKPAIDSYVFVKDGSTTWLSVRLSVEKPAAGDAVVGQWLMFSGIAKADFEKSTGVEAYVEKYVEQADTSSSADLTLTGTVKAVDGRAMLLECEGNSQFTTVWVELGNAELDPMVGETYVVTYEDIVMPSLPPRITAITVTKA